MSRKSRNRTATLVRQMVEVAAPTIYYRKGKYPWSSVYVWDGSKAELTGFKMHPMTFSKLQLAVLRINDILHISMEEQT